MPVSSDTLQKSIVSWFRCLFCTVFFFWSFLKCLFWTVVLKTWMCRLPTWPWWLSIATPSQKRWPRMWLLWFSASPSTTSMQASFRPFIKTRCGNSYIQTVMTLSPNKCIKTNAYSNDGQPYTLYYFAKQQKIYRIYYVQPFNIQCINTILNLCIPHLR